MVAGILWVGDQINKFNEKGVKGLKITRGPSTLLYPAPVLLVSAALPGKPPNALTIAWAGVLCSDPPTVGVSIRPNRHTHHIIRESGEFVVNVPSAGILRQVDRCGVVSGRDVDKFELTGLTPVPGTTVRAPLIAECPVNLECRVIQVVSLGSHDLFIGQVVATHLSEEVLDAHGRIDAAKADPLAYVGPNYFTLDSQAGFYGYSNKA